MLGNHDYNNDGLMAELSYCQNGWRIDDFFWNHEMEVDGEKIGFVHIDTSFLAYGPEGESNKKKMKPWFEKLKWTNELVLYNVDQHLKAQSDAKYRIAIGHHQVGHTYGAFG